MNYTGWNICNEHGDFILEKNCDGYRKQNWDGAFLETTFVTYRFVLGKRVTAVGSCFVTVFIVMAVFLIVPDFGFDYEEDVPRHLWILGLNKHIS